LDARGTLHHVIVRGIERRRIVDGVADRKNFVKRLGELSATTKTGIYAWVRMTNHGHIYLRSAQIGLVGFMRPGRRTFRPRPYQKSSTGPIN
jgi:hypothetical protein